MCITCKPKMYLTIKKKGQNPVTSSRRKNPQGAKAHKSSRRYDFYGIHACHEPRSEKIPKAGASWDLGSRRALGALFKTLGTITPDRTPRYKVSTHCNGLN